MAAARVAWTLRLYGHAHTAVVDGGWAGYVASGGKVESGAMTAPHHPHPAFTAAPPNASLSTLPEVLSAATGGAPTPTQVVDARRPDEYHGTGPSSNAYPGHVPGAVNICHTRLLDPARPGHLLPPPALSNLFHSAGLSPDLRTITYCHAGMRAALMWVALQRAGFKNAAVYDASAQEWCNQKGLPVDRS